MSIVCTLNSYKVQCTLFGHYMDDLNAFLAFVEVQNVVVLMQLAKVRSFQGDLNFILYFIVIVILPVKCQTDLFNLF